MSAESEKRQAAARAVEMVQDGMDLGLGTGSTAAHAVDLLGQRVAAGLKVRGVPTSEVTAIQARQVGIPLVDFETVTRLDLTIDGADEFDSDLNLTKGGGGALLREKIVAGASDRLVIITDASKKKARLGAFPLPIEVIKFAAPVVRARVEKLGAAVELRHHNDDSPFVTDEGNWILDAAFGEIADPAGLAAQLSGIPGVVEHGLFVGMADAVILAAGGTVEVIEK